MQALDDFRSRTWIVEELVLVRSHLPRSGVPGEQPRYEAVARRALGAAMWVLLVVFRFRSRIAAAAEASTAGNAVATPAAVAAAALKVKPRSRADR